MKHLLLSILLFTSLCTYGQQTFSWSKIADYPYKAWGMNACGHNGYLYTFSNCGGGNNTLYRYSPTADKWDTLAKLTGGIICNTAISGVGGKLYLTSAGGVQIYDIAANTWGSSPIALPTGFKHSGASAIVVGTDIYYIGGGATKNLFKLSTTTQTFSSLADMNEQRENAQVVYQNNKIYALGGRKSGNGLTSGEVYDITNNSWTTLTSTFEKRYFGYAIADADYIYLMGGETGTNSFKYKTIELFNPTNGSVTIMNSAVNDMNREHTAFALGIAGGKLIAAAGYTNTPNNATTDYCEAANFTSTVGIWQHIAQQLSFNVYPNPAHNTINITLSHPEFVNTVSLYNVTGQLVGIDKTSSKKNITLNISELPSGTYFIKAEGKSGIHTEPIQILH
ncbi:MAG: T9SS type A sorting domain-containing protein [Flavipsychrobacter sp.]